MWSRRFFGTFIAVLVGYAMGLLSAPSPGPLVDLTVSTAHAAVSYLNTMTSKPRELMVLDPVSLELDRQPIQVSLAPPAQSRTPHFESPLSGVNSVSPTDEQPYSLVSTLVDSPVFDSTEPERQKVGQIRRGFGVTGIRIDDSECQDRGRNGVWYRVSGGFV
ncbi:MAG: hypothetical protein AAFY60_19615 [Myxococcota bacterium]